jgi:hypothetical protein
MGQVTCHFCVECGFNYFAHQFPPLGFGRRWGTGFCSMKCLTDGFAREARDAKRYAALARAIDRGEVGMVQEMSS